MMQNNRTAFKNGMQDGLPIALGYFAVAVTLGIAARNAGLTAFQGFLASVLNNASAGEYAGFVVIAAGASYAEIMLVTLIANARYLLMGCAVSQKFAPDLPIYHRLIVGFDMTDEIFGITIARPGYLNPFYNYGAMAVAIPGWASGTAIGIIIGNILPGRAVSALSVALFGMFLSAIIPEAKKNKIVAAIVAISFAASYGFNQISLFSGISDGTKTIILTLVIAGGAAVICPVRHEEGFADQTTDIGTEKSVLRKEVKTGAA